jgi:hypothetical protein
VPDNRSGSRGRKPTGEEPDYCSYERASEPVRKLIDAEAEIARELGLNKSLHLRLSRCVTQYLRDLEEASQVPRVKPRKVRSRLKSIKTATSKLRDFFTENPRAAAARAELKSFEDRGYGFAEITPHWKEALSDDQLRGLQESVALTYELLERKSVYVDGVDVLWSTVPRNFAIDVTELSKTLDVLCASIGIMQPRGQDGRPASETWNRLMRSLAAIYQDATGKKPTITENEHRAEAGERYSGQFIRLAALLDRTTANYCGTTARPNSALGPALRRLLEPR